jgi:hypothetical protein
MRAIEKLSSRQTALKERKAADRAPGRLSAIRTPKSAPITLSERPAASTANKSSAWTSAVEKLRSRQTLLERAGTARTTGTIGAFNRMWDGLRRDVARDARLGALPESPVRSKPREF